MATLKLLIKQHPTGLKYLCKTEREDHASYPGSGVVWRRHLREFGKEGILTTLLFETEDRDEFRRVALRRSVEFDVVNSPEWANMRPEDGDGGATTTGKRWITNGVQERNIADEIIPDGWYFGRCKGAFLDSKIQIELAARVDRQKSSSSLKEAWSRRDSNGYGKRDLKGKLSGDKNPTKRPEVRKKISEAMLNRPPRELQPCPLCGRMLKSFGPHKKACRSSWMK